MGYAKYPLGHENSQDRSSFPWLSMTSQRFSSQSKQFDAISQVRQPAQHCAQRLSSKM